MKRILIAGVLATLGACGSSQPPEDRALNQIDAELARREANRVAMAAAAPANRALIVGRWSASSCDTYYTEYREDGTFRNEYSSGRWTLEGTRLTTTTTNGAVDSVEVTLVSQFELRLQTQAGANTLLRCRS